eukprot:353939-Chlamydomonas_euryale.AAC.8
MDGPSTRTTVPTRSVNAIPMGRLHATCFAKSSKRSRTGDMLHRRRARRRRRGAGARVAPRLARRGCVALRTALSTVCDDSPRLLQGECECSPPPTHADTAEP